MCWFPQHQHMCLYSSSAFQSFISRSRLPCSFQQPQQASLCPICLSVFSSLWHRFCLFVLVNNQMKKILLPVSSAATATICSTTNIHPCSSLKLNKIWNFLSFVRVIVSVFCSWNFTYFKFSLLLNNSVHITIFNFCDFLLGQKKGMK